MLYLCLVYLIFRPLQADNKKGVSEVVSHLRAELEPIGVLSK